jgi:hypothetical protein
MPKNASRHDELDGPLMRIRLAVQTQLFSRNDGEWLDHSISSGPQFTVVKKGDAIDLETAQPVLSVDDIPLRALAQQLLKALLRAVEKEK